MKSILFYLAVAIIGLVSGEVCKSPEVNVKTYTTTDGTIVSSVAFIAEFEIKCQNNAKVQNLYADVNGKILLVTKSQDGKNFQVSWTEESGKASSGTHTVQVYDEEGYSALRKAQRSGEDSSSVPVFTTLSIYHPGTYRGPWFQSEFLASILFVIIWYFAYSAKTKLLA